MWPPARTFGNYHGERATPHDSTEVERKQKSYKRYVEPQRSFPLYWANLKPLNYPFVMSVVGILPHNIKRGLLMIMKNLENLVFSWHAWPELFIILILYRHILYFLYWHSFFQRNKESLFFLLELKHSLDLTQLFIFHLKKSYYCSRLAPVHEILDHSIVLATCTSWWGTKEWFFMLFYKMFRFLWKKMFEHFTWNKICFKTYKTSEKWAYSLLL